MLIRRAFTGFWLFNQKVVAIASYQDALAVLRASSHRPSFSPLILRHLNQAIGENSFPFLQGREWKSHRSMLQGAFNAANLAKAKDAMSQGMQVAVESLTKRAESSGGKTNMDMSVFGQLITMDTCFVRLLCQTIA